LVTRWVTQTISHDRCKVLLATAFGRGREELFIETITIFTHSEHYTTYAHHTTPHHTTLHHHTTPHHTTPIHPLDFTPSQGTVITRTGDASKSLYFVLHGRVDVFVEKKHRRHDSATDATPTSNNSYSTHNNSNSNSSSTQPAKKPSGVAGERISTLLQGDLFGVTGLINKVSCCPLAACVIEQGAAGQLVSWSAGQLVSWSAGHMCLM